MQADADAEGPDAMAEVVAEDAGHKNEVDEDAELVKIDAVEPRAPRDDEEEKEDFGDDGGDERNLLFAEKVAVFWIGDVLNEKGDAHQVSKAEDHPRNEELAEWAVGGDVAEGGKELHLVAAAEVDWFHREDANSHEQTGKSVGAEKPWVVGEGAIEQPTEEEGGGDGEGFAGEAGGGKKASARMSGVVFSVDLCQQGDAEGDTNQGRRHADDINCEIAMGGGGDCKSGGGNEPDEGADAVDALTFSPDELHHEEAEQEADAGQGDEEGFPCPIGVKNADGEEDREGGANRFDHTGREGAEVVEDESFFAKNDFFFADWEVFGIGQGHFEWILRKEESGIRGIFRSGQPPVEKGGDEDGGDADVEDLHHRDDADL